MKRVPEIGDIIFFDGGRKDYFLIIGSGLDCLKKFVPKAFEYHEAYLETKPKIRVMMSLSYPNEIMFTYEHNFNNYKELSEVLK